ncbi:MAG: virulence factor BrkB family protein [Gammaproteobacteria bacterium]
MPRRVLDKIINQCKWIMDFLAFVTRQFMADGCQRTAASLSYTTVLSLVPLIAVMFVALKAFPVYQDLGNEIQDYIFRNFVPAASESVQSHIQQFATRATQLTAAGIIFLVLIAVMMMATIENALNKIWRVRAKRHALSSFAMYWAVLTLGPLLVGVGLVATSYVVSLPLVSDVEVRLGLKTRFIAWTPFVTTTLAFTLLYMLVPNRRVPFRPAVIGGIVAALLFEVAKRGFAFYVTHFPTYEAIYGALVSIPLFLVWVYLSWLVILLGAEITRSLVTFPTWRRHVKAYGDEGFFVAAYRTIGQLWEAQRRGRSISTEEIVKKERRIDDERATVVLDRLAQAQWVHRTASGKWVLSRDLGQQTLLELYESVPGPLPVTNAGGGQQDEWDTALRTVLEGQGKSMQVPLKSLYEGSP